MRSPNLIWDVLARGRYDFTYDLMRYPAMKHNVHEIEQVRDFARRKGFDLLTIRTLVVVDSPGEEHRKFVPTMLGWAALALEQEGSG